MPRTAPWTYELPARVASPSGIEAFVVESADGEHVGRVAAVLRRDGEVYLAVEQGAGPLARDLRALRWEDVEEVELDQAAVRLRVRSDELEERALVLPPDKQVEQGPAEAERLEQPPSGLPLHADPAARGPQSRRTTALLPFAIMIAAAVTIVAVGLAGAGYPWAAVIAGVAAFAVLVAAATMFLRVRRDPYDRD